MRYLSLIFILALACTSAPDLPYIGSQEGSTERFQVPDFAFINQDGEPFTQASTKGKVYVADFFFTSCPTICPSMKTQMLRVHETFKKRTDFILLSHTIDPDHDSLSVLRSYKTRLVGNVPQWQFLRAEKLYTHNLAQKSYFVSALEDSAEEGGFVHSGAFVLVDQNKHIRGVFDGTKPAEVDKLIDAIKRLLP